MLTSQARETLANVEAVIIDEIHAMAGTKRGAHLMFSLERLEELTEQSPQRIALSATQRPLDEIARFLGGNEVGVDGTVSPRPVTVVDAGARKELQIEVVVPIEDMANLGQRIEPGPDASPAASPNARRSIWPSMHPRLLELIEEHRSTWSSPMPDACRSVSPLRLNELAIEKASGEFDGSVAPRLPSAPATNRSVGALPRVKSGEGSPRLAVEDAPTSDRGRAQTGRPEGARRHVVAGTRHRHGCGRPCGAGASPGSVASGMQRIGRAGHQVGQPSVGKIFPKHRADLLEAAVVVDRMHQGLIEETYFPRNPLDVLAQQLVAMWRWTTGSSLISRT